MKETAEEYQGTTIPQGIFNASVIVRYLELIHNAISLNIKMNLSQFPFQVA